MLNIAIAIIALAISTIFNAGVFKSIKPHFNGECNVISGIVGAEDITMLRDGLAIISSDDRRSNMHGDNIQGGLFLYDIDNQSLLNLTKNLEFDFHPHGLSVFTKEDTIYSENQIYTVAVVNHRSHEQTIEFFELIKTNLTHIKTIRNDKLVSPNDLVLINKRQFYFTNDHLTIDPTAQKFYNYLQIPRSNVVFYDGSQSIVAAKGLTYANGINISPDLKTIYVAESLGKKISIFSINNTSKKLKKIKTINVNTAVDNIEIDHNGDLWIAGHPKVLEFVKHTNDVNHYSPSQVIKISFNGKKHNIDEVFLNDGKELSGSSVASVYNNNLFIGTVFDDKFLHCKMYK
tara:strand:+ start:14 stop:1051 length:1038 start_codon:yes stop_codon:yes gene_type:complete